MRRSLKAENAHWPFEFSRSWVLAQLGVDAGLARVLGMALVAVGVDGG